MISLREIIKNKSPSKENSAAAGGKILFTQPQVYFKAPWGCVKSLFMALRAKFKFETDVFFMILLRKIMKNTSVSKEYSAAEGGELLCKQSKSS